MIKLQENYKNFVPHPKVIKSAERLIAGLPQERTVGLNTIILTNTKALNNKKRRKKIKSRKRKVSLNQCCGWYIEKWQNNPAYIELLIDNIFLDFPRWLFFSSFFVELTLGQTLFHEVGHHIHKTQEPEFKDKENVADKWKDRFVKKYFLRRYWYIIFPLRPVVYFYNKFNKRT